MNPKPLLLLLCMIVAAPAMAWQPVDDVTKIANPANITIQRTPPQTGEPMKDLPGVVVHRPGAVPAPIPRRPIAEDFSQGPQLAEVCFKAIRPSFFDPYSARMDRYQTYRMPDDKIAVVVWLNGKNRFGAYVGAKPYRCYREDSRWRVAEGDF